MTSWTSALAAALGDGVVETDPDIVAAYSRDQAPLAPAGIAAALVRGRSIEHVVAALRFANERRIPVVARSAGTGLAGGANAIDGSIILSVAALDRILRIDAVTRTAVVKAGVLNGTLAAEVAAQGLYYAPDPASRDISTIGGNIATNAGGACCLKYGVTGDHVAALRVVTADGTLIRTGGLTAKNVAGLDLTRLSSDPKARSASSSKPRCACCARRLRRPRSSRSSTSFMRQATRSSPSNEWPLRRSSS